MPKGTLRSDYIIDDDDNESNDLAQSDLVKLVLNLPYMSEKVKNNFEFSMQWYTRQTIIEYSSSDNEDEHKHEDHEEHDHSDESSKSSFASD